ncbi:MAG: Na+/H+ antiporter NhaA [Deltaproteobacteria bacterium]|nr:Na+/H+ antiporter NhaA [Deltaproteobacteria bacterium]MBW1959739.1 Na+/H+ antiporter NhaA [Deltaproteobacteria bacterium]
MSLNSSPYMAFTRQLIADQILRPAQRFFRKQVASSVLLLAATVFALIWANSNIAETYHSFWHTKISLDFGEFHISKSLVHWINDGLMALFFFTVGLEIKRELLVGELASPKKALLPVIAAVGGMLVPALIYIAFNLGSSSLDGWGIPMATDIAFALGAVAIFGHNLPVNLRIFLAAFAIADDLGAVLVIAIFYTKEIVWFYVFVCVMLTFCLAIANLLWIRWTLVYAVLGLAIWFFVLGSGIHPTVAGVIVSLFIPARGRYDTDRFLQNVDQIMAKFKCEDQSCGYSILLNQEHMHAVHSLKLACNDVATPLQRLMHVLHPWVAFTILPFFALSNTGLNFHGVNFSEVAVHTVSLGIFFGLVFGKPLGVMLFSFIAVKSGMGSLPKDVRWSHILGSAMLGGIGFTMSLFIADLSFSSVFMLNYAKMAILSASVISAIIGISFLGFVSTTSPPNS